jgi:23S rRNA pseudouridine955/2504/2580 synthase/23S rRNA pseudouridine1911/1915/1917 synthase
MAFSHREGSSLAQVPQCLIHPQQKRILIVPTTGIDIVTSNDHFIVVNKPAGLLSIPDREGSDISLRKLLQEKYGQIFTVHRLDRDTSGIIVFAKDEQTHRFLSMAFEERQVEKYYLGIVIGKLSEKQKTIDAPIIEHPVKKGVMTINKKGKPAVTDYEVVEEFGKYSLLKFRIHTGRTHQIRVHMQQVGHPIACDDIYGDGLPVLVSSFKHRFKLSKNEESERPILSRLALHAACLRFTAEDGTLHNFEALLPKDMWALLQQLKKHSR